MNTTRYYKLYFVQRGALRSRMIAADTKAEAAAELGDDALLIAAYRVNETGAVLR